MTASTYEPSTRRAKTTAYKVLTHNYRPPLQRRDPVFDGSLPYELPIVDVDESDRACARGWNACAKGADALRIAGLWPDGWPSRLYRVETDEPVIAREDKVRAATWTIVEQLDVEPHVRELSAAFGAHAEAMHTSQMAWYHALGRPLRDESAVEDGLRASLDARGLDWTLRRYDSDGDVRAASDAWDTGDTGDASHTWDVWYAWAASDASHTWDANGAGDASDAWGASDAWAAWAAWAAWGALTIQYAALMQWTSDDPLLLTTGIREAYYHGLAVALPVADGVLGWAIVDPEDLE